MRSKRDDASRNKGELTEGMVEELDDWEGVMMGWWKVGRDVQEERVVGLLSLMKLEEERDEAMADLVRKRDALDGQHQQREGNAKIVGVPSGPEESLAALSPSPTAPSRPPLSPPPQPSPETPLPRSRFPGKRNGSVSVVE